MSIGATLAGARQRAGLTIADVSAHTRIRSPIIRAIERDDFGVCGGDFYARGHIRAIARTVGLDPEPLVRDYDAAHSTGQQATMDDPPPAGQPAPSGRPAPDWRQQQRRPRRQRTRPPGSVLAVFLTGLFVIGFGSYRLASSGSGSHRLASAGGSGHPAASSHPASRSPHPGPAPGTLAPGTPSARPSPRPAHTAAPVHQVTPASAAAFGPAGTSDGDNPQNASFALSGNPSTPWHTDWYTTARFGNLESGTGLLLELGRTVTAAGVTIHLGSTPGADLQVRAGTSLGSLSTVASASDAGGTVRLRLTSPARVRYLVIWFTLLPPDSSGTYQADISGVTVAATGHAA